MRKDSCGLHHHDVHESSSPRRSGGLLHRLQIDIALTSMNPWSLILTSMNPWSLPLWILDLYLYESLILDLDFHESLILELRESSISSSAHPLALWLADWQVFTRFYCTALHLPNWRSIYSLWAAALWSQACTGHRLWPTCCSSLYCPRVWGEVCASLRYCPRVWGQCCSNMEESMSSWF